jgi:uncharacterized linocin/CFP29 family protein
MNQRTSPLMAQALAMALPPLAMPSGAYASQQMGQIQQHDQDPTGTEAFLDLMALNAGGNPGSLAALAGPVASRLMQCGWNVNSLRTNDVLRPREWEFYDRTVVEITRAQLIGVADLLARPALRVDLPNAFGITVITWDTMGDMTPANMNMTGLPEGERDRLTFGAGNLPVPITHKDFQINLRTLEASRRGGQPLDTTHAAVATRKVNEMLEQTLFGGAAIVAGGGTIYGYTNFPSRITGSVTASWALAGTTGAQIIGDVLRMIGAAAAINRFGPFVIYVPVAVWVNLLNDFKANGSDTTLQRILQTPGLEAIRPTTQLTGTNILMVQMTPDTIDYIVGFQPMPIMWETHAGFMLNFKVLAIMVPRLKADANNQTGIVHYS